MIANLLTSTKQKNIGVPKTVREKYDKLKSKNKNIEILKDTFGLDVAL